MRIYGDNRAECQALLSFREGIISVMHYVAFPETREFRVGTNGEVFSNCAYVSIGV